jgi:hypothetical protein
MSEPRAEGRIVAETPADENCFIGFHDVIPWSQDGSCIAIHRAPAAFCTMNHCEQPIDICLWWPQTGEIRVVDSTGAWNFQQGARLQWMPGQSHTLVFNSIENSQPVSVFKNVMTGERRVLPAPIYVFSPDGRISIAPNFATLAHRWKAYGYPLLAANKLIANQNEDGLWQMDIETGQQRLFISTQRVAEFEAVSGADPASHFLCHASFSPDGSRVVFLHRFFSSDGGLFTRMIATDREATSMILLAQEKVSHFDWIDNDTILVWARFTGGGLAQARSRGLFSSPLLRPMLRVARRFTGRWKKKLLAEAYYRIPVTNPAARVRYGWPALDADGHPMIARTHDWIVTDFYPDKNGKLPVILYNHDRNCRIDAHVFSHFPPTNDSDVKCDLHPRWNRTEQCIAVDTCESGCRQVRVLDVSKIVS